MSGTALLEWSRSAIRDQWIGSGLQSETGPNSGSAEDGTGTEAVEDAALRISGPFRISSPPFRAPARYFDRLAIRYRCSGSNVPVVVSWVNEVMQDFDGEHLAQLTLDCSGEWLNGSVDLDTSSNWDKDLSLLRVQLARAEAAQDAATNESEQRVESTESVEVDYIALDRRAFADTFVR
jgi:hypothetical protein